MRNHSIAPQKKKQFNAEMKSALSIKINSVLYKRERVGSPWEKGTVWSSLLANSFSLDLMCLFAGFGYD